MGLMGVGVSRWARQCQWPFYALYDLVTLQALPPTHTVDLTMDPTDIWTLPALVIPAVLQLRIMRHRASAEQRTHLRRQIAFGHFVLVQPAPVALGTLTGRFRMVAIPR